MTREDFGSDADARIAWLDAEQERALSEALRAAYAPSELSRELNEQLIVQALEDPLAPPTPEELAESERLREALEGRGEHPDLDLIQALRAAQSPTPLSDERIASAAGSAIRNRRANVIYVTFGAAAVVAALAAAVLLFFGPAPQRGQEAAQRATPVVQQLAVSRSTVPLFDEKFDTASTTERIDRIARSRGRELRENRYAAWGLR